MESAKDILKFIKDAHKDHIQNDPVLKETFNVLLHKFKKAKENPEVSQKKKDKLVGKIKDFAHMVSSVKKETISEPKKKSVLPKPALKKRDKKAQSKTQAVKFNDNIEVHTYYERNWNDYKRKDFLKGAFSQAEVQALMESICNYASQQDNPTEILNILCSKSKTDLPKDLFGAWPSIAECLPNRSVQSCHNLCRRRFNCDNYKGKWTQEEEDALRTLVKKHGTFWKEIALDYNDSQEKKRTPSNLKDKWKQMGADNYFNRNRGPWSLNEALQMFNLVCKATQANILRKQRSVRFATKEEKSTNFFELVEDQIVIYQDHRVSIEEIIPLLVKKKRAKKHLKSIDLVISWKTIAEHLQTRSVDDIRNFWQIKILPLFDDQALIQEKIWHQEDDIQLLVLIADQEIEDSIEPIDFDEIKNDRSSEDNRLRWALLLKGVGSVSPGMRYSPTNMANKIRVAIETKSERYAAAAALNPPAANKRTGMQSYINIVEYYQQKYQ